MSIACFILAAFALANAMLAREVDTGLGNPLIFAIAASMFAGLGFVFLRDESLLFAGPPLSFVVCVTAALIAQSIRHKKR